MYGLLGSRGIPVRVPCMVCMMHGVFRIRGIRWEIGLYEDGVSVYLEKQSRRVRELGAGSGVLLWMSLASRKLHVETWEGLLQGPDLRTSQEVEIVPGCAVTVACPSRPCNTSVSPRPGSVIKNMLGWSQLEKTDRSGVWLFRGALQGRNLFSFLSAEGDWVKKGSYRTAWAVPLGSSCSCSYAFGQGPAIGPHTGERCSFLRCARFISFCNGVSEKWWVFWAFCLLVGALCIWGVLALLVYPLCVQGLGHIGVPPAGPALHWGVC